MDTDPGLKKMREELEALARERAGQIQIKLPELSAAEVSKIIFELHTHQIELEMQNHELQQMQFTLQESLARYADLFDFAPVGYVTTDKKGFIFEANLTFCQLIGLDRDKILGMRFALLAEADAQDVFFKHFHAFPQSEARRTSSLRLKRKGEDPFWAELSTQPHSQGSCEECHRTVVIDITDRIERENEKVALSSQLDQVQRQESLGILAAGIAHNFNNLLVPILGFSEIIHSNLDPQSEMARQINRITNSALKAKALVNQILVFGQKSTPQVVCAKAQDILEDVLALVQPSLPPRIELHLDIEAGLPEISADPGQVHQAILNLIVNAQQAIAGKGTIWISLSRLEDFGFVDEQGIKHTGPHVCLTVRDSGGGIPEEDIGRIFTPFFTTKKNDEQGGTGLGLSTTSRIIKQHSGHITVQSAPGTGAEFRVFLPLCESPVDVTLDGEKTRALGNQEWILLVDDDPLVLEAAKSMLERLGYQVQDFQDPTQAVGEFQEAAEKYCLALVDYSMPCLSGDQLAWELKKIRPDFPVVMATGYSNLISHENLESFHCQALINKPYTLNKLRSVVGRLKARTE
jgi:PAS domain S-box-containing protein